MRCTCNETILTKRAFEVILSNLTTNRACAIGIVTTGNSGAASLSAGDMAVPSRTSTLCLCMSPCNLNETSNSATAGTTGCSRLATRLTYNMLSTNSRLHFLTNMCAGHIRTVVANTTNLALDNN